jgi:hypothetical protein
MDREAELEAKSGNVLDRVHQSVGILRGRGHQGYRVPASIKRRCHENFFKNFEKY